MPRKSNKKQKRKTFRENYFSEDILTDKIYKKGTKVFFILFPYNQPDNFKVFSGEVLYHVANKDFTNEYAVQIHTGFDKREILKDFFHNNWFKTIPVKDPSGLTGSTKKFSFTDHELVDSTDKYFDYGKYHVFFRNHSEKFTFMVNEAFIFEKLHVAAEYATKMSVITICNKIKDLHDIMCSDMLRVSKSGTFTQTTNQFFKLIRPLLNTLVDELGPEFEKFIEEDNVKNFLDDYILNRRYRRMEFTKSRKKVIEKISLGLRNRENDY